jgi:hypothetical protein
VVSGIEDALRKAFVDRTLEVSLHSANEIVARAAFGRVTHTGPQDRIPKHKRHMPTAARQQVAGVATATTRQHIHKTYRVLTRPSRPPRDDCVARRADSCSPTSSLTHHRMQRRWREWELICASGNFAIYIRRHGVRVNFKQGLRPRPFNHGVSMLDAFPYQHAFLNT